MVRPVSVSDCLAGQHLVFGDDLVVAQYFIVEHVRGPSRQRTLASSAVAFHAGIAGGEVGLEEGVEKRLRG